MCGIAGFWLQRPLAGKDLGTLETMTGAVAHRGPDGSGYWTEDALGVGFGHRRLSILDLSEAGAQPMTSHNQRFVITYNGELYNAPSLRAELEERGHRFRGNSDTEILLEAIARWGVEDAVGRTTGMFAFALWDHQDRCIYLVRDRLGIKPLYWGTFGSQLAFASELKAIVAMPGFTNALDPAAVADYRRYGVVHAPRSIYRDVRKLPPAHLLRRDSSGRTEVRPYWDLTERCQARVTTADTATEELQELIERSVKEHLASDVPLGTFLSGGIDSSLITATAQRVSPSTATTFTVGFGDQDYDEAPHALRIGRQLQTNSIKIEASPEDALSFIQDLPVLFDEPFADSSQLPTLLLSKLAREHVTVALSGDGGDELFAGYKRYIWARRIAALPAIAKNPASAVLLALTSLPEASLSRERRTRVYRMAELLKLRGGADIHDNLLAVWRDGSLPGHPDMGSPAGGNEILDMQIADTQRYLPDDILTKVDRASMAYGLEVRVPLLDHRIVEFALSLPTTEHIQSGSGKVLLRRQLNRYLPRALYDRPKQGFAVPLGRWLDGPLRPWADDLLSSSRIAESGFFDTDSVLTMWHEHRTGHRNRQYELWMVLCLLQWSQHWGASL